MKVLVAGIDTGSIKELDFAKYTDTSNPDGAKPEITTHIPSKGDHVVQLLDTASGLVVARMSGQVNLYQNFELVAEIGKFGRVVGLAEQDGKLIIVDADGHGKIYDLNAKESIGFEFADGLEVCQKHPTEAAFVVAGLERRPQIFKLNLDDGAVETVFEAKAPKNDQYDLPEKNLVTQATFLPSESGYKLAAVTKHGKLRVYDSTHGRKPAHQVQVSNYAINALVEFEGKVVTGDAQSQIGIWQTFPVPRLLGSYKDVAGATEWISKRGPLIAAGGLDRFLRVYEAESREMVGRVYTGEEIAVTLIVQDEDEAIEQQDDQLWKDIDGLHAKPQRQKRTKGSISDEENWDESDNTEDEKDLSRLGMKKQKFNGEDDEESDDEEDDDESEFEDPGSDYEEDDTE